jgi:two-component system chemotaxis response regulator CheB
MDKRNIIVLGASSGGFDAIKQVVAGLPPNFDAALFIVWHMSPDTTGILPDVLNKLGPLPAANAKDFDEIRMGHIYIAPPDRHLLLESNFVRVTKGPKENRFRPAVDPLFRSAAYTFGERVIGVVLSGALDDGTSGLWIIKERGGIAIVQDPKEATASGMPFNALREVKVDYILPVAQIGPMLVNLSSEQVTLSSEQVNEVKDPNDEKNKSTKMELRIALQDLDHKHPFFNLEKPSPFSCPECGGVLGIIKEGNIIRYRCHTGHAYSPNSLLAAIEEKTEVCLWETVREIQETVMLLNHLGDHFAENNQPHEAALYFQKAKEALERSKEIRALLPALENTSINETGGVEKKAAINKLAGR